MKHWIGLIGIIIAIFGWLVSNANYYTFIYRIIAPKYLNSISTFNKMLHKNFIVEEGDVGFSEISEIIKEFTTSRGIPIITQIKTLEWGNGVGLMPTSEGAILCNYRIKMEISFANFRPTTAEFFDLDYQIKKRYLGNKIFKWSDKIFWLGIIIGVIGLLPSRKIKEQFK